MHTSFFFPAASEQLSRLLAMSQDPCYARWQSGGGGFVVEQAVVPAFESDKAVAGGCQ